ncbi:MAG: electron transfer flavoprotein alpha subunit [Arenicella sp.]|jgi:electron transfer flavoprotein alpha subunit
MSVLVFVETDSGEVKGSSHEAVYYASKLGGDVTAIVLGDANADQLAELGKFGATKVLHASDPRLNDGVIQAAASAVAQAAEQTGAENIIMARSSLVDAIASRVAIKLGAAVASNVISLPDTSNGFIVKRSIYTGKAFVDVTLPEGKKVITIKKNSLGVEEGSGAASIEAFSPELSDADFGVKLKEKQKAEGDILLPEADLVVSAGRGLKGPENWGMVDDLAKTLGAATACSKPVSDMDWRPHHEHVGQTGIKVAPNLYIAAGISGAIQHLAGVNSSKVIVVINKDSEAPFFKAADYGIVGDAFDVLPKLNEELKKVL